MDYGFWIAYLIPACIGLWGGWWLRGVQEEGRRMEQYRLMRDVERAKQRHPAYKQGYYEERLF